MRDYNSSNSRKAKYKRGAAYYSKVLKLQMNLNTTGLNCMDSITTGLKKKNKKQYYKYIFFHYDFLSNFSSSLMQEYTI